MRLLFLTIEKKTNEMGRNRKINEQNEKNECPHLYPLKSIISLSGEI